MVKPSIMTAEQLREWRRDRSQEEAAELLGMTLSAYRKLETGVNSIREPIAKLTRLPEETLKRLRSR